MRATILVDNISSGELCGEWGLSVYIEYQGKNILLDTGASTLFLKNAKMLGKDMENVDFAVLSHAHYDHADGMHDFFACNQKASFYLREGCAENCYKKKWFFRKYIGLPKGILEENKERIVFVRGDETLCPGVALVPHKTAGLEKMGRKNHMYVKTKNGWRADDFSHEQSLVLETQKGLVIFNSCSHGGADHIIQEVQKTYPGQKIYALVGGFHIYDKSEEEIRELAGSIRDTGICEIYTGHCTGGRGYHVLKDELGDMVHRLKVGLVIEA